MYQSLVTLDMEGVLTPEIWIAVAEATGIPELRRTTRDEPDYDTLMRYRLAILDRHELGLSKIQQIISGLTPLDGALDFLNELRALVPVIILSDTFEQFATPFVRQLGWPTLFCNRLIVENDRITGYRLRVESQKLRTVKALQDLNYRVVSVGDSFNDTGMLLTAQRGFFFRAPPNVRAQFPHLETTETYPELMRMIRQDMADAARNQPQPDAMADSVPTSV